MMDSSVRKRLRANFVYDFLATFVVVMIVFSFFTEKENTLQSLSEEFPFAITAVVLAETVLQIIVNSSQTARGKESLKSAAMYVFVSTVVIAGLISFVPIGLIYLLAPDFVMGHITYIIFKSIVAAFAGAVAWTYAAYHFTDM